MHRRPKLLELIKEWQELELDSTCVALDTFTSVEITKTGKRIVFINKCRGQHTEIARVYVDEVGVTGMVLNIPDSAAISIMLFSLEIAIETF